MQSGNSIALRAVIAACAMFGATQSHAADYCLKSSGSINVTYVGKNFQIPAKGRCAVWSGFCSNGCSPDNLQTGAACTASNGSRVSFVLTTAYLANNRQWDFVRLNLPASTGSGNSNNLQEGINNTISYSVVGASCNVSVP